jgi:hypothetical protein
MLNEDPNKNFYWQNKLEGLEYLPGETFHKAIAWDKLHRRLRGKRSDKKFFWYRVAAASLLFVLMIAFLNYHKSSPKLSTIETTVKQPKKTDASHSMVSENKKTENINRDLRAKHNPVPGTKISNQKNYSIIPDETISKIHLNDIHSQKEPSIKSLQILDTNSSISIVLPAKKKLNVVHINELGDPVVASPDITRNSDKHSFKLKLAREEVFVNSSIASKTAGFTILNTKPPSN